MIVLGIDPGTVGAWALVNDNDGPFVDDLPVFQAQHGRSAKTRTELDLHHLRALLGESHVNHVFMERVTARPGQGVTSMFRFGESSGQLYGLMVGLGLPVTFVTPKEWQKHHGVGASPDAARQRAVQLFPDQASMFARKRDQHRADAILIAAFGRQSLQPLHTAITSRTASTIASDSQGVTL